MRFSILSLALLCLLAGAISAQAQPGKYSSQLWEISGKGMRKPSYLFGTMHISNKLAFHLGDSFYTAIRNVDVVGLELDPELWQSAIPRMSRQSGDYQRFSALYADDYLKKSSFAYQGFKGNLRALIAREPQINNALLYRTESGTADFEENTYLDLYIYQTGRKLGKAAAGVEDFMTSERLSMEAQQDAYQAEKKKRPQSRSFNQYEAMRALQDAYRKGDLDALDSLNMLTLGSEAYMEKFLYRRNEIQADAMDSIMQHKALFVGVGAAHLPGKRGVIELLRQKGYTLRPIHMGDYDARQKESIDTLRVPVVFREQWAADSTYSVSAPGPMSPLEGSELQANYADMANGSYYLVTRMKTMPLFNGFTEPRLLRIIDSLMYEAVPGKILSRTEITRDGYRGYDLRNRTRRGDMQRYNIFILPSEIVVFKMGGTENYVAGPEAETFFGSIRLRTRPQVAAAPVVYTPAEGGFSVRFPMAPVRRYTRNGADRQPRLELEATDPATGDVYTLLRKDMYSFGFLNEDSFEVSLMMESLLSDADIGKATSRKTTKHLGYAAQDVVIAAGNGDRIRARGVVQGAHEYLLAVRSKKPAATHDAFFSSLQFLPTRLQPATLVRDTFIRLEVSSPLRLQLDDDIASLLAFSRRSMGRRSASDDTYDRSPEQRYANFHHEGSGELIVVNTTIYPEYYYARDSARFWRNELRDASSDSDMYIRRAEAFRLPDGTVGYDLTISDTNSSRLIRKKLMLKGHTFHTIQTVIDGRREESEFVRSFFASAKPYSAAPAPRIFEPKTGQFFTNYYGSDTVRRKRAKSATSMLYFGTAGFPGIMEAIRRLQPSAPDYFEMKIKWIDELGYLDDSTIAPQVSAALHDIYHASADTSTFQNAAIQALARLGNPASTRLLKQLLTEDPPVFDNSDEYDYGQLFDRYADTLKLAATLYPELLRLAPIADYKRPVLSLLARLVDSGYVKPELYRYQLPTLLFDARIALKKQQAEDDLALQADHAAGNEDADSYNFREIRSGAPDTGIGELYDYAVLLMPFYDENPGVPKFLERLQGSKKSELRARTALQMLRHGKPVDPGIWTALSSDPGYRSRLYTLLRRADRPELLALPDASRQQVLTESALRFALGNEADSLLYVARREAQLKGQRGQVYVYKYKKRGETDWNLAMIGLQPADRRRFNDAPQLLLTGKSLNEKAVTDATVDKELRRALVRMYPGGREFYDDDEGYRSELYNILRNTQRRNR